MKKNGMKESEFECPNSYSCLGKDHKKKCKIEDFKITKYMTCTEKEEIQGICNYCNSIGNESLCCCEVRTNFTRLKLNPTILVS
jgi:hypothetical protein